LYGNAMALTPSQHQTIANERTKLLALALDRVSTGCVIIGVFAPLAASSLNLLGGIAWISGGAVLHLTARWVLGRLL
jgi:hypothetical protein